LLPYFKHFQPSLMFKSTNGGGSNIRLEYNFLQQSNGLAYCKKSYIKKRSFV
jgi:hypothetical protein